MKVRKIELKNYQQFKPGLEIDLTYPEGHAKAGQPLDKVCIIGQSGTGKTTLLNLLKFFSYGDQTVGNGVSMVLPPNETVRVALQLFDMDTSFYTQSGQRIGKLLNLEYFKNTGISTAEIRRKYLTRIRTHLIYFPAELIKNFSRSTKSKLEARNQIEPQLILGQKNTSKNEISNEVSQQKSQFGKIINFSTQNAADIWSFIDKDIVAYREKEIQMRLKISELAQKSTVDPDEIIKASEELKKWQKDNLSPVKDLADNCLDKILNEFGLRVRTQLDFQRKGDIEFIKIETMDGQEVPYAFLSTGTKQLVLTALPLYALKPKNTLILFDEPERSLYPDVQTKLIPFYTSMAEDSQFFFATHSPILAASFEPWEIVELKFNPKDHRVYREEYYKGERHVDNYFLDPRYLNWSDILMKVFDLGEEGNDEVRVKALTQAARLKEQLKKLKDENRINTDEGRRVLKDFEELAEKLAWRVEI